MAVAVAVLEMVVVLHPLPRLKRHHMQQQHMDEGMKGEARSMGAAMAVGGARTVRRPWQGVQVEGRCHWQARCG